MIDNNFTKLLPHLLPLSFVWLTLSVHLLCARYKVNYNKADTVIIPTLQVRKLTCNKLHRHVARIHFNQDLNPDCCVSKGFAYIHSTRDPSAFCFSRLFPPNPAKCHLTDKATEAKGSEESHPKWLKSVCWGWNSTVFPPEGLGTMLRKPNTDPILIWLRTREEEAKHEHG